MKRIASVLLVVAACAVPVHAQSPQPAATPGAVAPDASPRPTAAYKVVEPRVVADYPLPSKVDPRVCLEFATQAEIITCANRYLPARRRT